MNDEYGQSNKRGRGPSPILKFTLILILLIAVGFFVFYSIDNPGFLKEKFSFLRGGDKNGGQIPAVPEDSKVQTIDENEESLTVIHQGESGTESEEENITLSGAASGDESKDTGNNDNDKDDVNAVKSLSFWQKIINFLTGRRNKEEEENAYPSRLAINFYFSGLGEEKKLVSEERTINAGSPDIAVQNAINELLEGPEKPHYFPVIPAGTELLGAEVNENIAKIDFSQEFLENSLDTRILDEYIIYSIVNTLTEIPQIEGVIFYIEGVRIRMYGNVDLTIPSIRNKEFLEEE
ncbi:MAG: GerMN domain-containing protein [Elusimicrobia bacterium]|nr:GerMN domain-containing protein [Elusimicrobiota bacterium]